MRPFTEQITFLSVADLDASAHFYGEVLSLVLVVDQGDCRIYRVGEGGYLGVCLRPATVAQEGVIVTLVTEEVDGWHRRLEAAGVVCEHPPRHRPEYGIYQAFYRDPDGHLIEIQHFDDPDWSVPIDDLPAT